MSKKIYWVDLPNPESEDYTFTNIKQLSTREEAIKWVQENIDPNSKDGTINLITEGEQ